MSDRTPLPLVSVLMTVYNSEKYLREAIDSLLVQNYSNLEIILINDGSTDETVQIINSYNDPRIKFHDNGQNLGIVKSR
ncbi:MAG TPA: glycosyltransferase family 2 protein, partial [Flavihumibacter sp.]|nr:glycosyltransferase family 2 protein [Flavihumibacter sp.]